MEKEIKLEEYLESICTHLMTIAELEEDKLEKFRIFEEINISLKEISLSLEGILACMPFANKIGEQI